MAGASVESSEYGDINPWLIAVLVAIATFMEVLDTTIANVALRYIAGGLAVSSDEASWVITTYLVANSMVLCRQRLDCRDVRPQELFSRLHRSVHAQFAALRICLEPARAAVFPRHSGPGRRRHDAGRAVDPRGGISARKAQPGLCALWRRRGGGAGGWPDARRLVERQSLLALVFSDQRAGRHRFASPLIYFVLPSSPERRKERQQLWARGPDFDVVGVHADRDVSSARLEVVLDRGQIDDWFGSSFIVTFAAISATALLLFIPWELNRRAAADRHQMLTEPAIRHMLFHHAGDRRAADRDHADAAAAAAGSVRLHRDAGGPCDFAGRRGDHGA